MRDPAFTDNLGGGGVRQSQGPRQGGPMPGHATRPRSFVPTPLLHFTVAFSIPDSDPQGPSVKKGGFVAKFNNCGCHWFCVCSMCYVCVHQQSFHCYESIRSRYKCHVQLYSPIQIVWKFTYIYKTPFYWHALGTSRHVAPGLMSTDSIRKGLLLFLTMIATNINKWCMWFHAVVWNI